MVSRKLSTLLSVSGLASLCLTALLVSPVHASRNARIENPGKVAPRDIWSSYEFTPLNDIALLEIGELFSIYEREGDTYRVYVPATRADEFKDLTKSATLLEADIDAWIQKLTRKQLAGYESYAEIQSMFADYQTAHPDFVQVMDLPWMVSQNGSEITVLKISSNVEKDNPKKPGIVITGSTHGDEFISTAVVLGIVKQLIDGYGSDDQMTKFIDWSTIYVIPVMSPDSFHISRNVHGVDPNRVYPYPGKTSEPPIVSARNVMRFYDEIKPAGSLDYHGVQGSVMYPWGYSPSPSACNHPMDSTDKAWFDRVTGAMGSAAGYISGDICNTIYPANGGTVDAWYMLHETKATVIEVAGRSKMPSESEVPSHTAKCAAATWEFIEALLPDEDPNEGEEDDDTSTEDDDSSSTEDSGTSETDPTETESEDDESTSENDDDTTPTDDESETDDDESTSEDDDDASTTKSEEGDDDSDESDDGDDDTDDDDDDKDDDKKNEDDSGKGGCSVAPSSSGSGLLGLGLLGGLALSLRRRRK